MYFCVYIVVITLKLVLRNIFATLILLLFIFDLNAQGQKPYALSQKTFMLESCSVLLDTFTLLPSAIKVTIGDTTITDYRLENGSIVFGDFACQAYSGKVLRIDYRTFGFKLDQPYTLLDSSAMSFKEYTYGSGYSYAITDRKERGIIDSPGMDYKGSFARGLSVGNAQSLVLNSNFDMQLIGDLGNGLKVVAAISDENLPIQAQGNTQQLQEFDRVFIQVSKDRSSVTAGDYELRRPNSYFMNYFKKVKGITLRSSATLDEKSELSSKGSFAISRGKFARQFLVTREGNQGPYRLQGNNGERFLIVLAGTEKVFFNGILLTRGYDYDYIIDYNRAELTFSPTRIIARDARVIVEFEYTDISYLRSLYATETNYTRDKLKIGFNFYSEQDSKTSTGDTPLDSTDVMILANSGDDLSKSVRRSLRDVTPEDIREATRILYAGSPNPLNPDEIILVFTDNLDSAKYVAVFSEVAIGKGDYIIDNTKNKNGRVYKYVGKGQGTYLPVTQLIPPEQRQLITLNAEYDYNKDGSVYAEMGLSNLDKNRRSRIDNGDNTGYSSMIRLRQNFSLDTVANWKLKTQLSHEFVHKDFNALNPFRSPEFVRDWNVSELLISGNENLLSAHVGVANGSKFSLDYGFNAFNRASVFDGKRHEATLAYQGNRFNVRAFANGLSSVASTNDSKTQFIRPNAQLQYKLGKNKDWILGFDLDAEDNRARSIARDTLKTGSYAYDNLKYYISRDLSQDFSLKVSYSERKDYFAIDNQLRKASNAKELELAGKWSATANSNLQWSIIGRKLDVLEEELLPTDQSKQTVLGRLDYTFSALTQAIRSTTSYNTNSGQEPKIEYVFQRVEGGQGDYFLITDSDNPNLSNIQDFRFDPTNPLSRYIRLTLVNNEFIRTNNIELNQSLIIDPSKFRSRKKKNTIDNTKDQSTIINKSTLLATQTNKWRGLLDKFSTISNLRITKKQADEGRAPLASYLDFGLRDTSLVSYNALNSNTLFFNRGNVKYDVQLGNRNNQNRVIQVSGREDRGLDEYFLRARFNIKNKADIFMIVEQATKSYQSEGFATRDLDIAIYRIKPEVSIRPTSNTRFVLKYNYQHKNQRILSLDEARFHEFTTEYTLRNASKYSLDLSASFVNIKFTGLPNSPIEYDMLEGLKNGQNFLWNVLYTKRVGRNMDLTFSYEGRKTGISPVVNVGRAQLKATF